MRSLLVALGRIIIPYPFNQPYNWDVLAAFYQIEAATITAEGVSLADRLDYGVVDHCRWDVSTHIQVMSVNNGSTWEGGKNQY